MQGRKHPAAKSFPLGCLKAGQSGQWAARHALGTRAKLESAPCDWGHKNGEAVKCQLAEDWDRFIR